MKVYRTSHIADSLLKTAGDEWYDEETGTFLKQLSDEMRNSVNCRCTGREGHNKLYFDYTYNGRTLPLLATLSEFGYGGNSESVSARITAPGQPGFRIPGGFTRTRNAGELLAQMDQYLQEIFDQAVG